MQLHGIKTHAKDLLEMGPMIYNQNFSHMLPHDGYGMPITIVTNKSQEKPHISPKKMTLIRLQIN